MVERFTSAGAWLDSGFVEEEIRPWRRVVLF
jgi:hypothetical protein